MLLLGVGVGHHRRGWGTPEAPSSPSSASKETHHLPTRHAAAAAAVMVVVIPPAGPTTVEAVVVLRSDRRWRGRHHKSTNITVAIATAAIPCTSAATATTCSSHGRAQHEITAVAIRAASGEVVCLLPTLGRWVVALGGVLVGVASPLAMPRLQTR